MLPFYLTYKQKRYIIIITKYFLPEAKMKIGISTGCLYPMLTEDCIKVLTECGFDSFEIFFNTFSELEDEYTDKLKYILDSHNAQVKSIHPFTSGYESFLLFSNYKRRFFDGVNMYEMYFRTAMRLGAKKVILHGLRADFKTSLSDEIYFERFKILSQRAKQYGIELLQENVNLFKSNNIEFIKNMSCAIPDNAAFVCDIKQANLGNINPEEMLCAMGKNLRHIHINDFSSDNRCVLPGKGCFDFKAFFNCLNSIGFDGDIIIETYRFSFNEISELADAYKFLNSFVK